MEQEIMKGSALFSVVMFVTVSLLLIAITPGAHAADISVVDVTDLAEVIVKGDRVHFIAQVQTNGNILYSTEPRNGSYLRLTFGSNLTGYSYQFQSASTETPLQNLYWLQMYLDTTALTEGVWNYTYHVELEGGTSGDSAVGNFTLRKTDGNPAIVDNTEKEFTTRDDILISARITDPDGDAIIRVDVEINGTEHEMTDLDHVYTRNVGPMPSTVDSYVYHVYTGRKEDGDNLSAFSLTFHITITESGILPGDTLPVVTDGTELPGKMNTGSSLHFKITYTDAEGDPPEMVSFSIFNVVSGAELTSGKLLTEGGDYKTGVIYIKSVNLTEHGITAGQWRYKLKYRYNGTNHTVAQEGFNVVKAGSTPSGPAHELNIFTDPASPSKKEKVEFILKWRSGDGSAPMGINLRLSEDGSLLKEKNMVRTGEDGDWRVYSASIDLSNAGIEGDRLDYEVSYVFQGKNHTTPRDSISFSNDTNHEPIDPNFWLIIIVIIVTIIGLLSLFVFTFGKRDPY